MKTKPQTSEEKPSLVSPVVAFLISLVLPGLGHMLARKFRKGLTLLLAFVSAAGLWVWRINVLARRETGFMAMFNKSIRLQPILLIIFILLLLMYILIALDAYKSAHTSKPNSLLLWVCVLVFSLFWDGRLGRSNQRSSYEMGRILFRC